MSVLITICEFSWSRLDQGNQWLSSLDVYLFHYARGWIRPIINCSRVVYQKCKPPGWNFDDHPRESSVHSDKPRCTPLTQDVPIDPSCNLVTQYCTPVTSRYTVMKFEPRLGQWGRVLMRITREIYREKRCQCDCTWPLVCACEPSKKCLPYWRT